VGKFDLPRRASQRPRSKGHGNRGGSMPASVNRIKKTKKGNLVDKPSEPIHWPAEPIHVPSLRLPDPHRSHARSPDPAVAHQIRPPACRIRPLLTRSGRLHQDPPPPRHGREGAGATAKVRRNRIHHRGTPPGPAPEGSLAHAWKSHCCPATASAWRSRRTARGGRTARVPTPTRPCRRARA
jgi:hypothetical protein